MKKPFGLIKICFCLLIWGGWPISGTFSQVAVKVDSGANIHVSGNAQLSVDGDWDVQGAFNPGLGSVRFIGQTMQSIQHSDNNFNDLQLDNLSQNVTAHSSFSIQGQFSLLNGGFDLNGYHIILGNTATLSELNGNTVYGDSGYLTTTRVINAPTNNNIAGLGLEITSSSFLGNTEIRRGHSEQASNTGGSILRYFEIIPEFNTAPDASLVFNYHSNELNGQNEANLQLFHSGDGGQSWTQVEATLDIINNTVSANNIYLTGLYTLSANCIESATITQAVCQSISLTLDPTGNASISVEDIDAGSTGACGIANASIDITNFDCTQIGAQTVTLSITGNDGITSTCQTTVIVQDLTPPVAICKDAFVFLDANGNASITAADIDNGSSDICGIANISLSQTSFDCNHLGSNTVLMTVSDIFGNQSSCSATVTVLDFSLPSPDSFILPTIVAECSTTVSPPTATDNCSGTIIGTTSGPTYFDQPGFYTIFWTLTDNSGNSISQLQNVIINDFTPPSVYCQDISVNLDAFGTATISPEDIDAGSSDACGIANLIISQSNFDCNHLGENFVFLTAFDVNGNFSSCVSKVTVLDNSAPVPDQSNLSTITGECSATITNIPTATDNCGGQIVATTNAPLSYFQQGTYTVLWTFEDGNGNTSTQSQTVLVSDMSPPEISADLLFIQCEDDEFADIYEVESLVSDYCDPSPQSLTVIEIPQLVNPNVIFMNKVRKKLKFKLANNTIRVRAPGVGAAEAWWQEILADGGVKVQHGQEIKLSERDDPNNINYRYNNAGNLKEIQNNEMTLLVTGQDQYGNVATPQSQTVTRQCLDLPGTQAPIIQNSNELVNYSLEESTLNALKVFPNPFAFATNIQFSLVSTEHVTLNIYNLQGELVRHLYHGTMDRGSQQIKWNGTDNGGSQLSSGIYLCQLRIGERQISKQVILQHP